MYITSLLHSVAIIISDATRQPCLHLPATHAGACTHSCTRARACTHTYTLAHPLTCFCSPNIETPHFLVRIQLYPLCYKNHSGPGSLLLNKIKWLSWPGRVAHTWRTAESSKPGWATVMTLFQKQKTKPLRPRKSESVSKGSKPWPNLCAHLPPPLYGVHSVLSWPSATHTKSSDFLGEEHVSLIPNHLATQPWPPVTSHTNSQTGLSSNWEKPSVT